MRKILRSTGNRRILTIAAVSVVGIAVVAFLMLRGGAPVVHETAEAETINPVYVTVQRAVNEPITEYAEATGTVRPVIEAKIAPKIMSNVSAVYVHEGDSVKRGQLLVKLESSDLSAQVAQASAALSSAVSQAQAARTAVVLQEAQSSGDVAKAKAALNEAREQLAIAQKGPRKQERSQAHLAVAEARAQFKNAEIELGRMQRLYQLDAIPKQRVDQAQMTYDVAKAQYEAAQQHADLVEEGTRQEEIKAAEARVKQAEESLELAKAAVVQNKIREAQANTAASEVGRASANLEYAKVQNSYATITSPINGTVTSRMVDPGDTVSPGVPMISIEDNSKFRLEVTVPESELPLLKVGDQVAAQIDATGLTTKGRVAEIVPSGDPGSRKFLVKVDLPEEAGVRTGQFGRIRYSKDTRPAVTVPKRAVRDFGGLTGVLVVRPDGKAHLQVVKAGKIQSGRTEVVSGLMGEEKVVVSNEPDLGDGVPVKVRRF